MESKKKVPTLNKVAYGIGTGGGCIFNQIAAAFLLNYYTDTVLIGAGAIATMLATFSALGNNIIGLLAGSLITPLVLNFGWKTSSVILGGAAVGYNPVAEPTQAVINAVKFDYTWMGAILGIIILIIVLLLDVEKYADQYNND